MRTVVTIIDFLPRKVAGGCFLAVLLVLAPYRHIFMSWEPQVLELPLDQDRRDS